MLKKINNEYYHFHDNKTGFDFTLKSRAVGVCASGHCWRLKSAINGIENVIACFMTIDDGQSYYKHCYGKRLWKDFFHEILPAANQMIVNIIGYDPRSNNDDNTDLQSKFVSDEKPSAALAIRTDKKTNAAYWDAIDDVVFSCIKELAQYSVNSDTKLVFDENDEDENENTTFCDLFGDGIVGEVRDIIIKYFEENGAEFPFVNENM